MIGCLILSTQRSGSNWLAELITRTGRMGNCTEWLHTKQFGNKLNRMSADAMAKELVASAATDNGRFSFKIFPPQLYKTHVALGIDIIRKIQEEHSTSLMVLHRRDRIRQAISLARSKMTGAWSSNSEIRAEARYDFERICEQYFMLERNNSFWRGYLDLRGVEYETFYYEDMLEDPHPCVDWIAERLNVEPPDDLENTKLTIQRNATTEEWVNRFRDDLEKRNILDYAEGRSAPARSPSNLLRFFAKAPLKPFQV